MLCTYLVAINHNCLVSLYNMYIGVYYPAKGKLPIIVMEKMYNSLRGLVERHTEIPFTSVVSILNDVCCGLQYLHSRNPQIVHRDLTPNNILLCYHLRAKITDLGVAKVMQTTDTKTLTKMTGVCTYLKPLVISCLDDNPKNRPSVVQVLSDITKVNLLFFSTVWSTEGSSQQQSTTQLQDQQHWLPNYQQQEQEQQEQPKLQEGKQDIQLQEKGKEYEQLDQKRHSELRKLDAEQLPQVSYANYLCM